MFDVQTGPCPACGGPGFDGTSKVQDLELILDCGHRVFVRLNAYGIQGNTEVKVVTGYGLGG